MGTRSTVAAEPAHDRFWDSYSRYYDSVYRLIPYRSLLWDAYQALDLRAGMRVLDAGCGTGNFEHFIAEKNHPPIEVVAIDFAPAMLEKARQKCADLDYVRFVRADLNGRLPFEDATFDRIVSINVLYALENQDESVAELLRVLKPEGRLVIGNPAPEFSVRPIATDHLKRIRNIWGTARRARALWSSLITMSTTALGTAALSTLVINRREQRGDYHSMARAEMQSFFERRRPDGLAGLTIEPAMANQALLATASKALVA